MFKRYLIFWKNEDEREEFLEHLRMNGYHFDIIRNNLYVYEEETAYVETVMNDRNMEYKGWD